MLWILNCVCVCVYLQNVARILGKFNVICCLMYCCCKCVNVLCEQNTLFPRRITAEKPRTNIKTHCGRKFSFVQLATMGKKYNKIEAKLWNDLSVSRCLLIVFINKRRCVAVTHISLRKHKTNALNSLFLCAQFTDM